MLGCILLAVGIFAQVEAGTLNEFGVGDVLASPAIILIILGALMFILGFSGCLGALREVFFLLVIVSVIYYCKDSLPCLTVNCPPFCYSTVS